LVAEDDTDLGELVNTGSTLEVVVGPTASGMESVASCGRMIRDTCMSACASTVMYYFRREDSDIICFTELTSTASEEDGKYFFK